MARQPWKPTAGQERVALQLCGWGGGWARTRPDGLAELRTVKGGGCHLYLIQKDGTSTLVESGPPAWAHDVVRALCWFAFFVFLGSFLPWWDDSWQNGMMVAAFGLVVCGGLVSPLAAGTRDGWTWITRYPAD